MKTKRHLLLSLKKKSGVISEVEAKELEKLEVEASKSDEDKKKEEEAAKKAADDAAAAAKAKEEEDKKKKEEEDKKKPAEEQKEGEAGTVTLEALASKIDSMAQNLQMCMEALAQMMDVEAPAAEEGEEAKAGEEAKEDEEKEEDLSDEEMEKALEAVVAELEELEADE